MILEAEKLRSSRPDGVFPSESEGLTPQETAVPAQGRAEGKFSLPSPPCSVQAFGTLDEAHPPLSLLSLLSQTNVSLLCRHPHRHTRVLRDQPSGPPAAQPG